MSAQFAFLNLLRKERRLVVVYLLGGTRLQGRIASFDQHAMLLETKTGMVLCSQDQISTVGLDLPRSMLKGRKDESDSDLATMAAPRRATRSRSDGVKEAPPDPSEGEVRAEESQEPLEAHSAPVRNAPVVTQKLRRKIVPPALKTGTGG